MKMTKPIKLPSNAQLLDAYRQRRRAMLDYYESATAEEKISYQNVGDKFGVKRQRAQQLIEEARRERAAEQKAAA